MKHQPAIALIALLVVAVGGCATPKVALDQANNTVHLIQNLQTEIVRYQTTVKLSTERRIKSIQHQDDGTIEIGTRQQLNTYLSTASGMTSELDARNRLRDASDTYAKIVGDQDKAQQDLADRLANLAKDLPSPTDRLGAVQKAMADLGTELSASERVAIVTKFIQQAKCIVDQAEKSTTSAAAAASAAAGGASAPSGGCTNSATTTEQT